MDYLALATDGDGTLVRAGHMGRATIAALKRWKKSGRKLVLVTGETPRQLADFPNLDLFDRIVAKNGAIIVDSRGRPKRKLGKEAPPRLVNALRRAGIEPRRGRLILQAELSDEEAIADALRQLKTDWQIVRNRHELMVVPAGVSKATGLSVVLRDLKISPRQVVAVGDAENDGPMLNLCGLAVAVNNAVPKLKKKSQRVTSGQYGKGIAEVIDRLLGPGRKMR
jgi:hydroxymethylpyrimidine pyrophosphatase-like HAD family hydrolase